MHDGQYGELRRDFGQKGCNLRNPMPMWKLQGTWATATAAKKVGPRDPMNEASVANVSRRHRVASETGIPYFNSATSSCRNPFLVCRQAGVSQAEHPRKR